MNYGERQDRAEMLIKMLRKQSDKIFRDSQSNEYTYDQLASFIEDETEFGQELVAFAGLVIQALKNSPELFNQGGGE